MNAYFGSILFSGAISALVALLDENRRTKALPAFGQGVAFAMLLVPLKMVLFNRKSPGVSGLGIPRRPKRFSARRGQRRRLGVRSGGQGRQG